MYPSRQIDCHPLDGAVVSASVSLYMFHSANLTPGCSAMSTPALVAYTPFILITGISSTAAPLHDSWSTIIEGYFVSLIINTVRSRSAIRAFNSLSVPPTPSMFHWRNFHSGGMCSLFSPADYPFCISFR